MAQPFGMWDLLAMNRPQEPVDPVQAFLAKDPSQPMPMPTQPPKPSRQTLAQFDETGVMGQAPIQYTPQPTADDLMAEEFKSGIRRQEDAAQRAQQGLDQLGERPQGLIGLDLSPVAALVDSWTGSNLSQGYRGPQAVRNYDQQRAQLQAALDRSQGSAQDQRIELLKLQATREKNDEANRLREMMISQRATSLPKGVLQDGQLVPDFEPLPGVRINQKQVDDVRKLAIDTQGMKDAVTDLKSIVSSASPQELVNPLSTAYSSVGRVLSNAQVQAKELANLGVLNGPDLALVNASLGGDPRLSPKQRDVFLTQYDAALQALQRAEEKKARLFGFKRTGGEVAQSEDPLEAKKRRLAELRAKAGQ